MSCIQGFAYHWQWYSK